MADTPTPEGKDPDAPKRETLRISLPPRPLRPATAKITPTPRPNVSGATTLPSVPDGGSTVMLMGLALTGVAWMRRKHRRSQPPAARRKSAAYRSKIFRELLYELP